MSRQQGPVNFNRFKNINPREIDWDEIDDLMYEANDMIYKAHAVRLTSNNEPQPETQKNKVNYDRLDS